MRLQRFLLGVVLVAAGAAQAQVMYRYVDRAGGIVYTDRNPPADATQVEERRAAQTGVVESGPTFALKKAQEDFPVTLYRGAECDAICADAKALLDQRGVPYGEAVIRTEEDAANYRKQFGAKDLSVPALMVGPQKQVGFEPGIWSRLLDDAGYPRSAAATAARSAAQSPAAPNE